MVQIGTRISGFHPDYASSSLAGDTTFLGGAMRKCPMCGEEMQQDVDDYPSNIWECSICGHAEENQEAEDFDPGDE